MIAPALYSSARQDWATPPGLVPADVDLDVCATAENAKAPHFFTPEQDAFKQDWVAAHAWCNPPYGRGIRDWLAKGYQEFALGNAKRVTYLLPARTDTRWWHTWVEGNPYCRTQFIKGRVWFVGASGPAPFPSVLVTFGRKGRK